MELAFQVPGQYKISGLSTKLILKRAVRELVPAIVLREPNHGFAVPTELCFQGQLRDFVFEILLDEPGRGRGYFSMEFIEQPWREHIEGRRVWDGHLWLLLNFELWHRKYLDEARVPTLSAAHH